MQTCIAWTVAIGTNKEFEFSVPADNVETAFAIFNDFFSEDTIEILKHIRNSPFIFTREHTFQCDPDGFRNFMAHWKTSVANHFSANLDDIDSKGCIDEHQSGRNYWGALMVELEEKLHDNCHDEIGIYVTQNKQFCHESPKEILAEHFQEIIDFIKNNKESYSKY